MAILITGANRGIGRALFDRYRDAGEPVIGTARGDLPTTGDWRELDVADPDSAAALGDGIGETALDLLVCNAGVYLDKHETLAAGFPARMWADTFAVNVTGVFLTIQALLPHLRRAATPRIAIISSQMASQTKAPGGAYIYRASKAAALNLGRNLAADLQSRGIAVGIYHPGWVITDMGGASAAITVDEAAAGLIRRFEELDLAATGCFRTWDGRDHPL